MKMRATDYFLLADAIDDEARASTMRERWDALWASGFNITPLYAYLNDAHIDTALRQIFKDRAANDQPS